MKADLTRLTHDRHKHFARVVHQQGRVPLDADINEQVAIDDHRDTTEAVDVIGRTGVPKGDSFLVEVAPDGGDLLVVPGHLYIDGHLCEADAATVPADLTASNELTLEVSTIAGLALRPAHWVEVFGASARGSYRVRAVSPTDNRLTFGATDDVAADLGAGPYRVRPRPSYIAQPDDPRPPATVWPVPADPDALSDAELPAVDATQLDPGVYQVYVDMWDRHLTALEDPTIREVALGGPDTCSRVKAVWQLRLRHLGPAGTAVDCTPPAVPDRGGLRVRARLPSDGINPCLIEPGAQYRRLENQLYRVEVHGGGMVTGGVATPGTTYKFSRDNGSVVVRWLSSTPTELVVDTLGRDQYLSLAAGDWIELLDDRRELGGEPGTLVQIDSISGTTLTMKPGTATDTTDLVDFVGHPRIRRWDHVSGPALEVGRNDTVNEGYVELEDGVQIRFEDGAYATGDHWTIPARTITADIEWPLDVSGEPLPRPPEGIDHHYAALAVVEWTGTAWSLLADADCRDQFPPLTHICAEDVCVDGDPCGLGAQTVQEAIEKLCAQQDLPWHNRHLHGWGVVCGLQVKCAPELDDGSPARESVLVEPGYALHPTGHDIRLGESVTYPIVDAAVEAGIVARDDNGGVPDTSVRLWIDLDTSLHVEPYQPKNAWSEILDGTLLMDIYEGCIKRLLDFFRDAAVEDDDGQAALVGPSAKRKTTLLNLLWQLLNRKQGAQVYLSGERAPANEGPNHEDRILRELFEELKALLQSETFCAMFDDVLFPEYDVYEPQVEPAEMPHPRTIFGKGCHTRLRVHPDRAIAMTCNATVKLSSKSSAPMIHVYDLDAGEMIAEVEFPSVGAVVQDIAFRPGTDEVFAAAWIGDASADSAIVAGKLRDDGTVEWTQNQVTCAKKIVTLASGRVPAGKLYAAARGEGIFAFDMDAMQPKPPRVGGPAFATGHLVLQERGNDAVLYWGAHAEDSHPVAYDHVVRTPVSATGGAGDDTIFELPASALFSGEGHDDIEVGDAGEGKEPRLFVVVDSANGDRKALLVFHGDEPNEVPEQTIDLGPSTEHRLGWSSYTQQLFVTYEDQSTGRQYSAFASPPILRPSLHPLQIGPISVTTSGDGRTFYVLNWLSRTITVIPAQHAKGSDGAELLPAWQSAIDRLELARYRAAVINAYLRLFGRFLQYLKDCVCSKLLVDCPEIGDDKVYLADVSIRDGKVYQICNFSRKYVHSFPTVEYWLSALPVIPMIRYVVKKFCCSVLDGAFDKYAVDTNREGNNKIPVGKSRSGLQWASAYDPWGRFKLFRSESLFAAAFGRMSLFETLERPPAGNPPKQTRERIQLVGQPAPKVIENAKAHDVEVVETVRVSGSDRAGELVKSVVTTKLPKTGDRIVLVTDTHDRVIGYREAPKSGPRDKGESDVVEVVKQGRDEVTRLGAEVETLRKELAMLRQQVEKR